MNNFVDVLRQSLETQTIRLRWTTALIEKLIEEKQQLTKERDEARREVCDWHNTDESGCIKHGSKETAISRGWDCYEKETL
jgi:hypothetical protein